jgi:hypothetical protein
MMILAGVGGVCGLVTTLIMRRQSLLLVIVFSFVVGTVVTTLFFAVGQAVSVVYPEHHSITEALQAVLAGIFLCIFFTPYACGLPAAFFGYITYRALRHFSKKPSA